MIVFSFFRHNMNKAHLVKVVDCVISSFEIYKKSLLMLTFHAFESCAVRYRVLRVFHEVVCPRG